MIKATDIEILKHTMEINNLEHRRKEAFLYQVQNGFFDLEVKNDIAYLCVCNSKYEFIKNGIQRIGNE